MPKISGLSDDTGFSLRTESYSRARLKFCGGLFKKRVDAAPGRFWLLEPRSLRFKHGESMADLKVPYHIGADDDSCVDEAVSGLLSLISKRYEPTAHEGKEGNVKIDLVKTPPLKDRTYRTDIFTADSFEKKLAAEIILGAPYIDCAILQSWLGADAPGRKFVKWATALIDKALQDEARHGDDERTAYLALLAVINTVRKKKDRIKGLRVKGLTYEKLDLAVGLTVFYTLKAALRDHFTYLMGSGAPYYTQLNEMLLMSAVSPKSFLAIPASILSVSLNPYGINSDTYDALSAHVPDFGEKTPEVQALIEAGVNEVRDYPGALEAVKLQYYIVRYREESIRYISEIDLPGTAAQAMLYEIYTEDRLIKNLINDSKAVANLVRAVEEAKRLLVKDARRTATAQAFQDYLAGLKKGAFAGLLGARKEASGEVTSVVEGYYAYQVDAHIDKFSALMRGYLADRRGEFSQNMLLEEYNRGRLYRFSTDERPVLKALELEEEGQLCIDMKDFTRKTLTVKEIAMAEFMKEHFYKPILKAASRYAAGAGVVKDEKGIRLTNLLGDAVIFSGGVEYLVALARDIQGIIKQYRDQLAKRLPPMKDTYILEDIHRRFEARKLELRQKRAEINRAVESKAEGAEGRLIAIGEEEHRLENTYRDELAAAIRGELAAGLYISYGSKAETMVVEPIDDFTDQVKVAIGEKINEASRGTARNAMVRTKIEVLLEDERNKRGQKYLAYPFDVYIDRTYSLRLPPELESVFEKLVVEKKPASAQALAKVLAQEYYADLKKLGAGEPFTSLRLISSTTDIYNRGRALSKSALDAYIKETRGRKRFFWKNVMVKDLDASIREEFFFPVEQLELCFGVEAVKGVEHIDLFVRSGEVIFKGFEAGVPILIYEMVNPDEDFYNSIQKHHYKAWYEVSKEAVDAGSF